MTASGGVENAPDGPLPQPERGGFQARGKASEVQLSRRLKKDVIKFIGCSGDGGAIPRDIAKSVKGFNQACIDASGERCWHLQVIRKQLSEEIVVTRVAGQSRLFIKDSYIETYRAQEKEERRKEKEERLRIREVFLDDETKQKVILFVGEAGDKGITINQLKKSAAGFVARCHDLSGNPCSLQQVMREHFSDEIEIKRVHDDRNTGRTLDRFSIKQSYIENYEVTVRKVKICSVDEIKVSTKMRLKMLEVVNKGSENNKGVSSFKILKEVEGLRRCCRDESGEVSFSRFDEILRVHFGSEIEKRSAPKTRYFIISRGDYFQEKGGYV